MGIAARGPDDDELTIDVAWLGADNPSRVLLRISGIHGVEAYAGSVTQLAVLGQPLPGGATTPAAYGAFAAVLARREEIRRHQHGAGHLDHAAKKQVREALCPASVIWRAAAVAQGRNLVYRAVDWLFKGDTR